MEQLRGKQKEKKREKEHNQETAIGSRVSAKAQVTSRHLVHGSLTHVHGSSNTCLEEWSLFPFFFVSLFPVRGKDRWVMSA